MQVGSFIECTKIHQSLLWLKTKGMCIPKLNDRYTIRALGSYQSKKGIKIFVLLEEIINPIVEWDNGVAECAFIIECFSELKTPPALTLEIEQCLNPDLVEV